MTAEQLGPCSYGASPRPCALSTMVRAPDGSCAAREDRRPAGTLVLSSAADEAAVRTRRNSACRAHDVLQASGQHALSMLWYAWIDPHGIIVGCGRGRCTYETQFCVSRTRRAAGFRTARVVPAGTPRPPAVWGAGGEGGDAQVGTNSPSNAEAASIGNAAIGGNGGAGGNAQAPGGVGRRRRRRGCPGGHQFSQQRGSRGWVGGPKAIAGISCFLMLTGAGWAILGPNASCCP